MRPHPEQMDVGRAAERRQIGLLRADERETRFRQTGRERRDQFLIDPLVKAADISNHWPSQRRDVRGQLRRVLANLVEGLELHAERKQMHLPTVPRRAPAEIFRGYEDQVGDAEQPLLAGNDPSRSRRARGEIVDTVVDRQLGIERSNEVERERGRQERPDDRPIEADRRASSAAAIEAAAGS